MDFKTVGLSLGSATSIPMNQTISANVTAKTAGGATVLIKASAKPLSGYSTAGFTLGCASGPMTFEYDMTACTSMISVAQNFPLVDGFPTKLTYKGTGIGGSKMPGHSLTTNINLAKTSKKFGDIKASCTVDLDGLVDMSADYSKKGLGDFSASYKHLNGDVSLGFSKKDMQGLKLGATTNVSNLSKMPKLSLNFSHDMDLTVT
ncbi:hypothetical protein NFJ02_33g83930 [Pycnococcus provasolii]